MEALDSRMASAAPGLPPSQQRRCGYQTNAPLRQQFNIPCSEFPGIVATTSQHRYATPLRAEAHSSFKNARRTSEKHCAPMLALLASNALKSVARIARTCSWTLGSSPTPQHDRALPKLTVQGCSAAQVRVL